MRQLPLTQSRDDESDGDSDASVRSRTGAHGMSPPVVDHEPLLACSAQMLPEDEMELHNLFEIVRTWIIHTRGVATT